MPAFIDLAGKIFGRLTVISLSGKNKAGQSVWRCRCSCGNAKAVLGTNLVSGRTSSCGCYKLQRIAESHTTHGHTKNHGKGSATYRSWVAMRRRCHEPGASNYRWYGARGVHICDRWMGTDGFKCFLEDMGESPSAKHSIDRFPDKDGNYEPGNCRWALPAEQSRNRTDNVVLTLDGRSMCVADWAAALNLSRYTLYRRVRLGWTSEEVLTTPLGERRKLTC